MTNSKFESAGLREKRLKPPNILIFLVIILAALLVPCIVGASTSVTLKLDSVGRHGIEGHKVYVREGNQTYDFTQPIWLGTDSFCTINGLEKNVTYYFIARTYDEKGNTSDNSNEIKFRQDASASPSDSDQESDDNQSYSAPKLGPVLVADTLDPSFLENGQLSSTQWQIYQEDNDFLVFDATVTPATTEIQVPRLILEQDVSYYFIARYIVNDSKTSPWTSRQNHIDTNSMPDDANNDGIPDEQEADPEIDLDANGTPDLIQENARCIKTGSDNKHLTLSLAENQGNASIEALETIKIDELPIKKDIEAAPKMPFGLINVRLKVDNPGDQIQITIYLPPSDQTPPKYSWYFYDTINGWRDSSEYVTPSTKKGALTLNVTDGGAEDADGVENGIIVSQSGPATGGGNASYACFINSLF